MKRIQAIASLRVWAAAILLTGTIGIVSCDEKKFLNVTDPGSLSTVTFPTKLADMDLSLIDLYGRLRFGYYSDQFRYAGILPDHTADLGYNGSGFNEYAEIRVLPGDGSLGYYWVGHNEAVIRTNNFLQNADRLRSSFSKDAQAKLSIMEGQARFLRALNYFILESLYGETMFRVRPTGVGWAFRSGKVRWPRLLPMPPNPVLPSGPCGITSLPTSNNQPRC